MVNLLGLPEGASDSLSERLGKLRNIEEAHLHWYEKEQEKPGRKLGHVTVLLNEEDAKARREEALQILNRIRTIWPMFTKE